MPLNKTDTYDHSFLLFWWWPFLLLTIVKMLLSPFNSTDMFFASNSHFNDTANVCVHVGHCSGGRAGRPPTKGAGTWIRSFSSPHSMCSWTRHWSPSCCRWPLPFCVGEWAHTVKVPWVHRIALYMSIYHSLTNCMNLCLYYGAEIRLCLSLASLSLPVALVNNLRFKSPILQYTLL